eukprot:c24025_g2_i1 orf=202-609(+)
MQVSSIFEPDGPPAGAEAEHLMVSEFVLYDGKSQAAGNNQSSRIWSSDMSSHKRSILGSSIEGLSSSSSLASSEYVNLLRGSHSETAEKQCTSFLMTNGATLDNPSQASTLKKGKPGHMSSCSMDGWSDSGFPDL